MLRSPAPKRDERGAIAVMYAMLLLFVLIPVAALGVDLGNAVARRTATQTQADFSAYAGSDHMTGSETAGGTPTTVLVDAVAASMNANQPQDDGVQPQDDPDRKCWHDGDCVTRGELLNGNLDDGEVQYLSGGRVKVTAPANLVKFGLAGVLGFNQTTVGASATVMVKSPGLRVLPMFAVDGCDYGRQTLTDPAHVSSSSVMPTLADDTATNITGLTNTSGLLYDSAGTVVPTITVNSTGNEISFTGGNKWKDTTKVGFFREGLALPVPEADRVRDRSGHDRPRHDRSEHCLDGQRQPNDPPPDPRRRRADPGRLVRPRLERHVQQQRHQRVVGQDRGDSVPGRHARPGVRRRLRPGQLRHPALPAHRTSRRRTTCP